MLTLYRNISELQYEVGVIRTFAPLPRRVNPAVPTTGYEDVKRVALARLSLSIPSIQVDWSLYGPKLAQVDKAKAIEHAFNFQILSREVYYISELPSDVHAVEVVFSGVISLLLSFLATVYPSWRAARVNPAEALRYE